MSFPKKTEIKVAIEGAVLPFDRLKVIDEDGNLDDARL